MMDTRRHVVEWGAGKPRKRTSVSYWKQPLRWNQRDFYECKSCGWRGEGKDWEPQCCDRMAWTLARRRVFCASLADVFDNEVPPDWRADLFHLIERTPNLDWLLLTKRIGNAQPMIQRAMWDIGHHPGMHHSPPRNVWLGATIVNQAEAERDIAKLIKTWASVRFISVEPLLGAIDVESHRLLCAECPTCADGFPDPDTGMIECRRCEDTGRTDEPAIDWVIVGGESGHGARPMHPAWVRSLRDQCARANVPFLFKQWGEFAELDLGTCDHGRGERPERFLELDGTDVTDKPIDQHTPTTAGRIRVGKKRAGRTLDGRTHDAWPT